MEEFTHILPRYGCRITIIVGLNGVSRCDNQHEPSCVRFM